MDETMKEPQAWLLICDMGWSIIEALCRSGGEVQFQAELVATKLPDLIHDYKNNLEPFMGKLSEGSLASNIELALKHHGHETRLHFFGSKEQDRFIIAAGANLEEVLLLLVDPTVRSNRERDHLLQSFKHTFLLQPRLATSEAMNLDEMSRLNNELVNTSRELSKKNLELFLEKERNRVTIASIGDAVVATDVRGCINSMNSIAEELTGWSSKDAVGMEVADVVGFLDAKGDPLHGLFSYSLQEGKSTAIHAHSVLLRRDGMMVPVDDTIAPIKDAMGKTIGLVITFHDITERVRAEAYRDLKREILQILSRSETLQETFQHISVEIRTSTGVDAVGIRLQNGDDFPYYAQNGLSEDFLLKEDSLRGRGPDGRIHGDGLDRPCLDCMCGLVITGKADISGTFFTPTGSTWTNDSSSFFELPAEMDRRTNPRKECVRQGYASIAWIPIRAKDRILGLIQLYDRKKGRFAPESIDALEDIADNIGSSLLRRRAEEALQESEMRYRKLVDSANEAIVVAQDGILRFVNPFTVGMLGIPEKDLVSKPFQEFIHSDDRAMVVDNYRKRSRGEPVPDRYIFRLLTGDGGTKWAEISAVMIEWAGRPATLNFLADISERKRAEEALKVSESRFREIFNSASDAIYINELGPDFKPGATIDVNDAACQMLGYSREELLRLTPNEFAPNRKQSDLEHIYSELREQGSARFEEEQQRRDGTFVPVEIKARRIEFMGSSAALAVARDITERKRTEELLRRNEETLRLVVDTAPFPLMITDADGTYILDANEKAVNYFRLELARGQTLRDLFMQESELQTMIVTMVDQGFVDEMEVTVRGKEGDARRIIISIRSMHHLGEVRWIIATYDITERYAMEGALQQASKKLGMLNSITRHDIINQVLALSGYIELCKRKEKDVTLQTYLDRMTKAADNIREQITFTKEYQDIGVKAPIWASIGRHTADAYAMLHPLGVELKDDTKGMEVLADPLIEKVPYNLIDNSTRHGERVTSIVISADQRGDAMSIVYEDDGVGISDEDRKRLFEKGFGKNTGFGLFLCREILAITGITITETGKEGEGVRFEMLVPAGAWRQKN